MSEQPCVVCNEPGWGFVNTRYDGTGGASLCERHLKIMFPPTTGPTIIGIDIDLNSGGAVTFIDTPPADFKPVGLPFYLEGGKPFIRSISFGSAIDNETGATRVTQADIDRACKEWGIETRPTFSATRIASPQ